MTKSEVGKLSLTMSEASQKEHKVIISEDLTKSPWVSAEEDTSVFRTFGGRVNRGVKEIFKSSYYHLFTYEGLIGTGVDYKSLFTPSIPFTRFKQSKPPQFFGLNDELPLLLALLLGFQHALSMMGGLISPSIIYASAANLERADLDYLLSAQFIGAGFMSLMQVCRFRIPFTKIHVGTGMVSVLGETFGTIAVFQSALPKMYSTGYCPTADDGTKLPCRDAYGAFLGTSALCALFQTAMGFVPAKILKKLFPPMVTGPVIILIGASLVSTGMENWGGGSDCYPDAMCNTSNPSHSYVWGSGRWVGIGFSVVVAIILCDRFGAPIMKSCSVAIGLVVGSIVAGACGYFNHETIDEAPGGQFNWIRTFPLKLYGPIVLPLLAIYLAAVIESIGDITATADVSRLPIVGEEFESRLRGGLLASGLASIIGCLATLTPMGSFSQNNGVISLTQVAAIGAGLACCFWLVLFGVVGKWSATIAAMPSPVIGGMTMFVFSSIFVAGIAITAKSSMSRRDRFVLAVSLVFGFGSLLVPTWFDSVFTYKGDNAGKSGFINAIVIILETPYAVSGIIGCLLNLMLPEQDDYVVEINTYEGEDPNDSQQFPPLRSSEMQKMSS